MAKKATKKGISLIRWDHATIDVRSNRSTFPFPNFCIYLPGHFCMLEKGWIVFLIRMSNSKKSQKKATWHLHNVFRASAMLEPKCQWSKHGPPSDLQWVCKIARWCMPQKYKASGQTEKLQQGHPLLLCKLTHWASESWDIHVDMLTHNFRWVRT